MESINLSIPTSWSELSQTQLRYIFELLAEELTSSEIKSLAMLKWGNCKVMCKIEDGFIVQVHNAMFAIKPIQIAENLAALDWLDALPSKPVRLEKIGRAIAVDADFQGLPFEGFMVVENLFQGFLSTHNNELLDEIAHVLYPGLADKLRPAERTAVFYWVAAAKQMLAKRFADLFQPSAENENLLGASPNIGAKLEETMNAMIRALTKGDITKEHEILAMDCWRALTELNAQAKEYKQINAKINAQK